MDSLNNTESRIAGAHRRQWRWLRLGGNERRGKRTPEYQADGDEEGGTSLHGDPGHQHG
jgi:hypothetical protein